MSVVGGVKEECSISLSTLPRYTDTVHTDFDTAKAIWDKVRSTYRIDLTVFNGSYEHVHVLMEIIDKACIVVSDEVNRLPSGGILITRELKLSVDKTSILALVDRSKIEAIAQKTNKSDVIILVSTNAAKAVSRLYQAKKPKVVYYQSYGRPEREDVSCCKLLACLIFCWPLVCLLCLCSRD